MLRNFRSCFGRDLSIRRPSQVAVSLVCAFTLICSVSLSARELKGDWRDEVFANPDSMPDSTLRVGHEARTIMEKALIDSHYLLDEAVSHYLQDSEPEAWRVRSIPAKQRRRAVNAGKLSANDLATFFYREILQALKTNNKELLTHTAREIRRDFWFLNGFMDKFAIAETIPYALEVSQELGVLVNLPSSRAMQTNFIRGLEFEQKSYLSELKALKKRGSKLTASKAKMFKEWHQRLGANSLHTWKSIAWLDELYASQIAWLENFDNQSEYPEPIVAMPSGFVPMKKSEVEILMAQLRELDPHEYPTFRVKGRNEVGRAFVSQLLIPIDQDRAMIPTLRAIGELLNHAEQVDGVLAGL